MSTASEKVVTPYVPWDTFVGFVAHLKATAVPSRIDKSAMPTNMPALVKGQVQSTLKFLRLIDSANSTGAVLKELVAAYETDRWQDAIIDHLLPAYEGVIGELDLDHATQHQLDERFKTVGVTGQMMLKSVRFFLELLKAGGRTFSPHLVAKRRPTGAKKKSVNKASKPRDTGEKPKTSQESRREHKPEDGTRTFPLYFKDKKDGSIVVPSNLTEADCKVIELQLAVLRAYAGA